MITEEHECVLESFGGTKDILICKLCQKMFYSPDGKTTIAIIDPISAVLTIGPSKGEAYHTIVNSDTNITDAGIDRDVAYE